MANLAENNKKTTLNRTIGLLADGVELHSPSLFNESVYFGEIESVQILNEGEGYDVITPSEIEISSNQGQGAKIHGNMKGTLVDVLVLSSGIGYNNKPVLSVKGGNIKGDIKLETNLVKKVIKSGFLSNEFGIGFDTITFIGNHNFEDGEEVYYDTNNLPSIVGLTTGSTYFVGVIDSNVVSLHKNFNDAASKINAINGIGTPIGISTGIQYFSTVNYKNVIDRVYIENSDATLYNTSVVIQSNEYPNSVNLNGINTTLDYIYAKNHNLKEKDLIQYRTTNTNISGLSTTNQYYVTVLDTDRFKLSDAGSAINPDDTNYKNKSYVSLNSVGIGTHTFRYPPITIDVSIVSSSPLAVPPILKPVVLGSFESIFIENNGVGYGLSDVVNIRTPPDIRIKGQNYFDRDAANEAALKAVIEDGKIVKVIVLNSGKNYQDNIDIVVGGSGKYAKLYPNVVGGKIISVDVLSAGSGYSSSDTNLLVQRRGKNAKFLSNTSKWTIDQYFKNKGTIDSNSGNGFIIPSKNLKDSLQFINFFPSNNLRSTFNDSRTKIKNSPILGWAYDGNPIFGPYKINGNAVKSIDSSYKLKSNLLDLSNSNRRPPSSQFEFGYFIEDYEYDENKSELDENNGMFITDRDEFPNGTYAYFMTLDENDTPTYPYVIGNQFKNEPNESNNKIGFNQNIDITKKKYIKNTGSLYFTNSYSGYEFLKPVDEKYKQELIIKNITGSKIEGFDIIVSGENYKIGDNLLFDVEENEPSPSAKVSKLEGKPIININTGITTLSNVVFKNENNKIIGITTVPHGLENNQGVYISNCSVSKINGNKIISVIEKSFILYSFYSSDGLTAYIEINDVKSFNVGDYIKIDDELAKVLEVYPQQSKLFVQRLENLQTHTPGESEVTLLPIKFVFDGNEITETLSVDNLRYFNPRLSVGLGSTGTNINSLDINSNYFIPERSIYIPNHQFKSNQPLTYSFDLNFEGLLVGDSLDSSAYRLTNGQTVYAINLSKDYIGISTVAYGQTSVFFREASYSQDEIHSFSFTETIISGQVEKYDITINTTNNHELVTGDFIRLEGKTDTWEQYVVQFDLNNEYPVKVNNSKVFTISLNKKPEFIGYPRDNSLPLIPLNSSNIKYNTTSTNAKGGIQDIQLYYTGNSYKNIPVLSKIESEQGKLAVVIPFSNTIGKIDTVERIKDGFDYPSDTTLQPKLSTNTICYLDNISKIKEVRVAYGGKRYNSPPNLKVIGDDDIILSSTLRNSAVDKIDIIKNKSNLSLPLDILPVNNSNGFDILNIFNIGLDVNRIIVDINQFPLIYRDYAEPYKYFPFEVGDLIFIENCRILESDKNPYNSSYYSYSFFNVVNVDVDNGYIDYSIANYPEVDVDFGTYTTENGYGIVVNRNDMARFEMALEKENYIQGEEVKVVDTSGNIKFKGQVLFEDGWDKDRNQLRITKSVGILEKNDILLGTNSLLAGKVLYVNGFTLKTRFGPTRDKINYKESIADLNSDLKKLQDSYYYQDFSYSISSKIPYDTWKEPVKSIVHPSGFKEFSNLEIVSSSLDNLKIKTTENLLDFNINIENEKSFFTKNNFTIFYEEDKINETTTERMYTGSGETKWPIAGYGKANVKGIDLLPYILNITNVVKNLKKIDSDFNGSYEAISLGNYNVTFNSNSPNYLGVNTTGLEVGDIVGYSTYHSYPFNTRIIEIGIGSVRTLHPHKLLVGSVVESLELTRNLNHNAIVGLTSFRLLGDDDSPIYKITAEPADVDVNANTINLIHNFQTGQIIHYENIGGNPISISPTSQVIGGITTTILPKTLYVNKISENKFQVSGLIDSGSLNFTSAGTGIHKFVMDSPDNCTLISIDNIIQTPLHPRTIKIELNQDVNLGDDIIYVNSGINSITSIDIIKIEDEYLKVNSVGLTSSNSIEVERGFLGSTEFNHIGISTAYIYRGNYRIEEDVIYFTSPPYGQTGLPDLKVSSEFSGRVFGRKFTSLTPYDKNIILDDISDEFIGITEFNLKENGNNVVGLYTNTNDPNSININNNPLIFINNIPQVTHTDFEIINPGQNKIEFISGTPNAGKILSFDIEGGFGYSPLVAAAATVKVSSSGTISNVYLNGTGSGYRSSPAIKILSTTGRNASISASIDVNGKVSSLSIINAGTGYTMTETPLVIIDEPLPYYNLDLEYDSGSIGIGEGAKVSLQVEPDSSIQKVEIITSGKNYKVGDELVVVGLKTDSNAGETFNNLKLKVKEVISDDFTGIYPGQFIQFDDISSQFNSLRKIFDLTANINGQKTVLTFKNKSSAIKIENNLFIFINGILQEPNKAYQYVGGRLVFSEAPKSESTCNILYYQGSINDIELITPLQTIKSGDIVKFEDSELSLFDSEQEERVVKRLISVNSLDTFPYSGFGITSIVRPISWTKQKNDRIISGSLISKSRDSQKSNIYPNAKLIKSVTTTDTSFYVDNAYPLFIELDNGPGGITEERRNVKIINNQVLSYPSYTVNVSGTSTISSINVTGVGIGYSSNPAIIITNPTYRDPFYNIEPISTINTTLDFNSFTADGTIVAVGRNNLIGVSTNLTNWSTSTLSLPVNSNLQKIAKAPNNTYMSVGTSGVIIRSLNGYTNWQMCSLKKTLLGSFGLVLGVVDSNYTGAFNDIIYNDNINSWIAVGNSGKIYKGTGISTSIFMESISQDFDYKSVAYNEYVIVAVGNQGISTSSDGSVWYGNPNVAAQNYNSVMWDESRFILTSSSGVYTSVDNGETWDKVEGSPTNLVKITKTNGVYVSINSIGDIFTSLNLVNWIRKLARTSTKSYKESKGFTYNFKDYQVSVGLAGTAVYSELEIHKATLTATVTNSQITSITVTDGGFGYIQNEPPSILIEPPSPQEENIFTIKAVGDYGKIVGIKTSNTGIGTNTPSIKFELLTEYSNSGYESLNTFGITYSQLSIGDYFIINNSNVRTITGYALTGITTSLGGMANYPASRVGTAKSFLDGVYRVEFVEYPDNTQGIVTVTCHTFPVNGSIGINTSGVTTDYYGNYSWSKILDYENRSLRNPLNFNVNTNDGLIGLSTAPEVYRMPPLIF